MARVILFNQDPESLFLGSDVVPRLFYGSTLVFPVGYRITAARGDFQINGQSAILSRIGGLNGEAGSFVLNGQAANFLNSQVVAADFGAFSLGGQNALLGRTRLMPAANGAFTLNGQDVGLTLRRLTADPGYYDVNASLTDLYYNSRVQADNALFVMFGQDANFYSTTSAASEHGTFNLNGQAAGGLYNRVGVTDVGVYAFNGQAANLTKFSGGASDFGSYALTGQDAGGIRDYDMAAAQGSFLLGGQDANFLYSRIFIAAHGTYLLNGQAATLSPMFKGVADQGTYNLSGQLADLKKAYMMSAAHGAYAFSGQAATLTAPLVKSKVGSFNTGTGAVNSNVVVTGLGFQPDVVIFFWMGSTLTTDTVVNGSPRMGWGAAVSSTKRFSHATITIDAGATSAAGSFTANDRCVSVPSGTAAYDGQLDFVSMDSDGFTLIVDDQFANSFRIHYLALGGIDADILNTTIAASTGNQDYNSLGFTPTAVLLATAGGVSYGISTGAVFTIGAISAANQALLTAAAQGGGAAAAQTTAYCADGTYAVGYSNAFTTPLNRYATGSIITNGFRLNVGAAPGAPITLSALCIGGCSVALGAFATSTNGTNFSYSGFGFQPKAAIFASAARAESTTTTMTDHAFASVGIASSPTERAAISFMDVDAAGTMNSGAGQEHDEVYMNLSTANPPALQGLMDLVSFDSDGMTLVMDDVDPGAYFGWYLAVG